MLRHLDVRDLGAVGDGATLNTRPFQKGIETLHQQGGGCLCVPPGDYVTGTLRLLANVTLHLEAGTRIIGSPKREDYPVPILFHAEDAPNISIRGRGEIDGNSRSFIAFDERGWRLSGDWKPERVLQFTRCRNLLVEDVTIRNCPGWTLHPVDCDGVIIRGISIINGIMPHDATPSDGIDPDGCSGVRISDCYIQSGDDCVVIKCTRRPDGAMRESRDITVTNCTLATPATALKVGSETHGDFRNIAFSNCAIRYAGCGIGLWMCDDGSVDGWTVNNVSMTLTDGGQPFYMYVYKRHPQQPTLGTVRNIMVSDAVVSGDGSIFLSGAEESRPNGIVFDNIRFFMRGVEREKRIHRDLPYPFRIWAHRHSPCNIFCRYLDNLTLRNVSLTWNTPEKPEWGSAIHMQSIRGLDVDGFVGRQALGSEDPVIQLADVKDAVVRNCRPLKDAGTFLHLGRGTADVTAMNNDLHLARKAFSRDGSVDAGELREAGNVYPRGNNRETRTPLS